MASYPNSMSSALSSSQAVKYDDDETVDEIDGREHASKDDTDDADEDEDEEEDVKEGIEKEDWNKGVGGTIISISLDIGSAIVGNRSLTGVLGDRENERGVESSVVEDMDSPVGAPRK